MDERAAHPDNADTITSDPSDGRSAVCMQAGNDDDSEGVVHNKPYDGILRATNPDEDDPNTERITIRDGDPRPKARLSIVYDDTNGDEKETSDAERPEGEGGKWKVEAWLDGSLLDTDARVMIDRKNPSNMNIAGSTKEITIPAGDRAATGSAQYKRDDSDHDGDGDLS